MIKKNILERKNYNPFDFEDKIYKFWIPYFKPRGKGKFFVILIAPPNITGTLHMGHSMQNSINDVIARYKKMQGFDVIWLPGIDHAGIATHNVVEKELKKEGLTRFDLGREKFIDRVWQWKNQYGNVILEQFKKLGLSLDWSRIRFTMDRKYVSWVEKAFIEYYKKGFVYRDFRPVNYCPRCQTSLSDLELVYEDRRDYIYFVKYPLKNEKDKFIEVATTRPETMLGDVALAINPDDDKYQDLVGKIAISPINNKELPIIVDERVDPKFGTGVLKITPAHSLIDYEIGLRHQLPLVSVIDQEGRMNEISGEYKGLNYLDAREKIIERLKSNNLISKIEEINHQVPFCDRCKTEIQIIPSKEWFLRMDFLGKLAYDAVKRKNIKIIPNRFKRIYLLWLKNIHDWCISRKIWWGQQLPVWYCQNCSDEEYVIATKKPRIRCKKCKDSRWQRTTEVFDTWFSSALWPFAILYSKKEQLWYPADLVSSARDILYLWITRMIFSGIFFMKKEPFKTVFIHPTVLTPDGKRMSKSKGTGIDPLELIEKYGSDALRFGLLWQMTSHQDVRFFEEPIIQGKKFLNKVWNAYRFYFFISKKIKNNSRKNSLFDKKIIKSLNITKKIVAKKIEEFEFGVALKKIYKFFWNDLCDIYLESWKNETKNNPKVFNYVMLESLKILHPFLPHLTQLIYFYFSRKKKPLFFEKWK